MNFSIEGAVQVLDRTPAALDALLRNLSSEWTTANEGDATWNPYDVTGHLLYCDRANWLMRITHIMKYGDDSPLPPFDRYGGAELSKGKSLNHLLDLFIQTRKEVLQELQELLITGNDFSKKGLHPQFGPVLLSQLLSAWVAHDLSHLSQVCRVMAKQYKEEVGPWIEYLRILK
jgi:hypothetical protein